MTDRTAVVVNAVASFIQPAEVHGAKEDVPGAIREGLEADPELRQDMGDVDPAGVPADAAVAGHAAFRASVAHSPAVVFDNSSPGFPNRFVLRLPSPLSWRSSCAA